MNSPCDLHDCPITCYNFPYCVPLPPSPPPPPFTPINIPYDPDYTYENDRNNQFNKLLIATLLVIVFLFILFVRVRCNRDSGSHHNEPVRPPPPTPAPNSSTTIQTRNLNDNSDGNDEVTYHACLINTVGLDEHIIKSIPASVYNESGGSTVQCTVCLAEFSDGEEIKLLHNCSHVFHVLCIDTWLKSHVNCPLCRKAVVNDSDCSEPNQEPACY